MIKQGGAEYEYNGLLIAMPDRVQVKLLVLGKLRHNSRKKVLIPNMFRSMPRNWFGRENMMYLKTKNIFLQNKPNVLKDFVER